MPTNEERRKVAQKLRNSDIERHQLNPMVSHATVTICGSSIVCIDEESLRMALDYLADLIEPEPERTCHFEPDVIEVLLDEDGNEILDADGNEIETGEPAEDCSAFECSECGYPMIFDPDIGWFDYWSPYKPHFKYCPNCGAKVINDENV